MQNYGSTAIRLIRRIPLGFAAVELAAILSTAFHPLAPLFLLAATGISLVLIYYHQILLILLATVSLVKGALIAHLPMFAIVDYTVVMSALLVIAIVRVSLTCTIGSAIRSNQKTLALYLIWVVWMVICSLYAPDKQLAFEKSLRFALFNTILFIGPLAFIRSRQDSNLILKIFIIVAIIGSILILGQLLTQFGAQGAPGQMARLRVLSANPIASARVLAIAAGMATLAIVMNPQRIWRWGLVLLICLSGAILTGSRGPLLSYLIGTFVMGMLMGPQARRRIGQVSLLIFPILVLIFLLAPDYLTSRFLYLGSLNELAVGRQGFEAVNTILTRVEFWMMALVLWTKSAANFFFGIGTAGYPFIFPWRDIAYPHNMIQEVLAEFGLAGMLVFGMHLWLIIKKTWVRFPIWIKKKEEVFWGVGIAIMLLASMVSGDLNDNRMLWFLMGGFLATLNLDE